MYAYEHGLKTPENKKKPGRHSQERLTLLFDEDYSIRMLNCQLFL